MILSPHPCKRGTIVLVPFPFTDLSSQKVRPALVLATPRDDDRDVIVSFISSVLPNTRDSRHLILKSDDTAFTASGLKVASVIRTEKIATLDQRIVLGAIGGLPPRTMRMVTRALRVSLGISLR